MVDQEICGIRSPGISGKHVNVYSRWCERMRRFGFILGLIVVCNIRPPLLCAQEDPPERIVTPEEVDQAISSPARLPLRVISYPHRFITREMEKGLIKVERDHLRERLRLWRDRFRELGVEVLFGGLGEQTGFGGGLAYTVGKSDRQQLTFLGR